MDLHVGRARAGASEVEGAAADITVSSEVLEVSVGLWALGLPFALW
jgi:hypothetical protein